MKSQWTVSLQQDQWTVPALLGALMVKPCLLVTLIISSECMMWSPLARTLLFYKNIMFEINRYITVCILWICVDLSLF